MKTILTGLCLLLGASASFAQTGLDTRFSNGTLDGTFGKGGQDSELLIDPATLHIIPSHEARHSLGATVHLGTDPSGNAAASVALPTFSYQVTAGQDHRVYSGAIVGSAPATNTTTTISTVLIPVIIKITQGGITYTFDPTAGDTGCLGSIHTGFGLMSASPLFNPATFSIDNQSVSATGYGDALLKSEFSSIGGSSSSYHLHLSTSTGPAMTISINAGPHGGSTATVF